MVQVTRQRVRWIVVGTGLAVCLLVSLWLAPEWWRPLRGLLPGGGRTTAIPRPSHPVPQQGYVGSATCASCHPAIAESYAHHPMGRSSADVLQASELEDYQHATSFSPSANLTYRVEKRPTGVWHHEILKDVQGEVIYDQAVQVHLAMGSGRRGRTYVINRDGVLFQSPISWYSSQKKWGLSPGYTPAANPRFERRVIDSCVSCHVGRSDFIPDQPNHYRSQPILEAAIGCERCHGPGEQHVKKHASTASLAETIVNPAKLTPERRESVCNQCHLQGDNRVGRFGKSPHDFRPGERLADTWTVFVQGSGAAGQTTLAVSQVEQMRSSKCYLGSEGKLGCISCHNPHELPAENQRHDYFQRRCLTCHVKAPCKLPLEKRNSAAAKNSCFTCHMPRLGATDIPHTAQTDHRILRVPESDATVSEPPPLVVFDEQLSDLSAQERDRAWGLVLTANALTTRDPKAMADAERLLRSVGPVDQLDGSSLEALAALADIQNRKDEAKRMWEEALRYDPRLEEALQNLALWHQHRGEWRQAREYWERFLVLNPWRAMAYGWYAEVLWSTDESESAIRTAQQGLELNPALTLLRLWLVEAYNALKQPTLSEDQREMERRIEEARKSEP